MFITFVYNLIVIINCKHINEAISCVALAATVLQQNCLLIIQPIYNIILKIIVICTFAFFIMIALSSGTVNASLLPIGASPNQYTLSGVTRSFSGFDVSGNGTLYLWFEVFMM